METNSHINRLFLNFIIFTIVLAPFSIGKFVLTLQEVEALDKFRPLVNDVITHDYQRHDNYMVRWLQARKLNVKSAAELFKAAQKWRKENKIDSILNEDFQDLSYFYKLFSDDAVDFEGRKVFTAGIGEIDVRSIVMSENRDRIIRFVYFLLEKAVSNSAEAVYRSNGTLTDSRLVSIMDFRGFSLRKHACLACIPVYTKFARDSENYYPGCGALGVYINTPSTAADLIQSLLPLLSEETRNAFKAFGTNREEWTKYIRTIIPADQLTQQFGGTKEN